MILAEEAIKMSEDIQKQRKRKLQRDLEGRESLDELAFWNPNRGDFSVFDKPVDINRRVNKEVTPLKQPEENKLAALNNLIKNQEFKLPEQEYDFETFLKRLNSK